MKKLTTIFTGLALALSIVTGVNAVVLNNIIQEEIQDKEVKSVDVQNAKSVDVSNNVGNGEKYAYEITEINGDEINGIPLNKASNDNAGILLFEDEVGFDVEVGDKIVVVWGEYEDEFVSIERAVQAEDGSYVGESFYQ